MSQSAIYMIEEDERNISPMSSTWRIPRPSIHSSTNTSSAGSSRSTRSTAPSDNAPVTGISNNFLAPPLSQYHRNIQIASEPGEKKGTWSSSTSGEGSQSMLLTPHLLEKDDKDTVSIASSTHFTIINGMSSRMPSRSCCQEKYQLSILVVTMTTVIFLGIIAAVLFIQIRAYELRHG